MVGEWDSVYHVCTVSDTEEAFAMENELLRTFASSTAFVHVRNCGFFLGFYVFAMQMTRDVALFFVVSLYIFFCYICSILHEWSIRCISLLGISPLMLLIIPAVLSLALLVVAASLVAWLRI